MSLFLASVGIVYAVLALARDRAVGFSFACFLCFTVILDSAFNLQFTSVACLATISGMLLLFLIPLHRNGWHYEMLGHILCGTALSLLGSLWRPQAFRYSMVLCLSLPLALDALRSVRKRGLVFRCSAVVAPTMAAMLALSMLLTHFDNRLYRADPEWCHWRDFNHVRGTVHDRGWGAGLSAYRRRLVLESSGWSPNDYQLFTHWFYLDPSFRHLARVRRMTRALREASSLRKRFRDQMPKAIQAALAGLIWPWILCALLIVLAVPFQRIPLFLAVFSMQTAYVFALQVAIGILFKPVPLRLWLAAWTVVIVAGLLVVSQTPLAANRQRGWVCALLLGLPCLFKAFCVPSDGRNRALEKEKLHWDVTALANGPHRLFFHWIGLPFTYVSPLDNLSFLTGFKCVAVDYLSTTPSGVAQLERSAAPSKSSGTVMCQAQARVLLPNFSRYPNLRGWAEKRVEEYLVYLREHVHAEHPAAVLERTTERWYLYSFHLGEDGSHQ